MEFLQMFPHSPLTLLLDCALILVSLVAHEFGHALVARLYRVPVKKIGFRWTGVYIQRARTTGWPEIAVCLAGPMVNLMLAIAFWNVSHWLAVCNLTIGWVNLLPLTHSDGSHALDALEVMYPRTRVTRAERTIARERMRLIALGAPQTPSKI
jgi:Zn-dependent protease